MLCAPIIVTSGLPANDFDWDLYFNNKLAYIILGLTCTEQNFVTKAGAQRTAAEQGILIVAPDTSPRTLI